MLFELFVIFQVVLILAFFTAFFTHQEIIWGISFILSGVLMITSYNVEFLRYIFDPVSGAYITELVSRSFPPVGAINMIFFMLSLVIGLFDIFDKYGIKSPVFKH